MLSSRQNFETIQLGNKRWIFTYLFFFVLGMTFQAQMGLLSSYNSCYEQSDSSNGSSEAMDLPRKPEKENVEIAQTKSIRRKTNQATNVTSKIEERNSLHEDTKTTMLLGSPIG